MALREGCFAVRLTRDANVLRVGVRGQGLASEPTFTKLENGYRTALQFIAVAHATVIDPAAGSTRPDMTILVRGTRIEAADASRSVQVPAGTRVIDGTRGGGREHGSTIGWPGARSSIWRSGPLLVRRLYARNEPSA